MGEENSGQQAHQGKKQRDKKRGIGVFEDLKESVGG